MMLRKIIIFIFLICLQHASAQENNLLNYSNSLKYAKYLFENKLYDLSASEYERIVFIEPTNTLAKLRLVQSYRLMNDLKNAARKLDSFFTDCATECTEDFAIENYKIMFLENRYEDCLEFISKNKKLNDEKIAELKTAALLKQHKWNEARRSTESYHMNNNADSTINKLRYIALKGENIHYKNPFLAVAFSGVIPGSGKFYTGQWTDGLYSLLAVSALAYATYNSFVKNGPNPYGFIFGTVAFSFYTANIYGSYKSALRYNKTRNTETVKDVERLIFEKYKP